MEDYLFCRDSFYGFPNHHVNEKGLKMIASAAAFILIFLGAFLVLRVLSTPINAIVMRIPVLGHINRFLGLLFGAATALIFSWLFVLLVGFLDGALSLSFLEVNDSWIGGLFYRFSLFS